MALAPLDPLGSVEAAWAAAFRRRRALAVDDAGRGGGVAPQGVTGLACQLGSDHLPSAVIAPSIEISLHGRAWRKVLGRQTPLTAGGDTVENCVHHSTQRGPPRTAKPARPPDQLRKRVGWTVGGRGWQYV